MLLLEISQTSAAKLRSSSQQPLEGWKPWHCGRSCGPLEALGKITRRPKRPRKLQYKSHCDLAAPSLPAFWCKLKAVGSKMTGKQPQNKSPDRQFMCCSLSKAQDIPAPFSLCSYIPTAGGYQASGCWWCSCRVLNNMRSKVCMFDDEYAGKKVWIFDESILKFCGMLR